MSNSFSEETLDYINRETFFKELDADNYLIDGMRNVLRYHFVSKDFNRFFLNCLEGKAIVSDEQMDNFRRNLKPCYKQLVYTDPC